MSLIDEAKSTVGELLMVGFEGTELSDETSAFFSQASIGGTILFQKNYKDPKQVANLINQIQDSRNELPLWISVDQEGGRVQRFKEPFTLIPTASQIGICNSPRLTYEVSEVIAKELNAVGVNLNFCPVADIMTNPDNPVIGDRAYGTNEQIVTQIVTAMVRGHLTNKVQPCVKHFPGHGDTNVDSHFDLPKVDTTLETMRDREFKPFIKASKSRCAMLMTAHVVCTSIDPDRPATISKKIISEILREELRYSRIIISDDLEMKAIADNFGPEEVPVLVLQAGCDIMIYRSEEAGRHAYEVLLKAIDSGKLAPEIVIEAVDRCRNFKKEVLVPYTPVNVAEVDLKVGIPEHQEIVNKIK